MKTRADYVLNEKKKVNRGVKRERGKNTKAIEGKSRDGPSSPPKIALTLNKDGVERELDEDMG